MEKINLFQFYRKSPCYILNFHIRLRTNFVISSRQGLNVLKRLKSISSQLLLRRNVMLYFICMGVADLKGRASKRKIQDEIYIYTETKKFSNSKPCWYLIYNKNSSSKYGLKTDFSSLSTC